MQNLIEFPGLGASVEVSNVAFTLFGFNIYWYGVCIGVGMMLALAYVFSQAKRFGVDSDRMVDVILIGFVCAIVGGRAYYVLFVDTHYNTFFDLINLRAGGIAIYGAIIGAFLGAWLGCKLRKVPIGPMFDLAGMGFLIGQACGRWGNFFNQEVFGTNTTLPWGMISPATTAFLQSQQDVLAQQGMVVDPFSPVHPTFLYESLWCFLGLLLLHLYRKHRKFNGEIFLFYVIWYGFGRFFIEGMRTDSLMISSLGLRVSQVFAALSMLTALCFWIFMKVKTSGKPLVVPTLPPKVEKVNVETEDGVETVEISWSAEQEAPHLEEKRQLALQKLALQKNINDSETNEEDTSAQKEETNGSEHH